MWGMRNIMYIQAWKIQCRGEKNSVQPSMENTMREWEKLSTAKHGKYNAGVRNTQYSQAWKIWCGGEKHSVQPSMENTMQGWETLRTGKHGKYNARVRNTQYRQARKILLRSKTHTNQPTGMENTRDRTHWDQPSMEFLRFPVHYWLSITFSTSCPTFYSNRNQSKIMCWKMYISAFPFQHVNTRLLIRCKPDIHLFLF